MILDRYLARQFSPIFAVAVSMFVLLLSLIDLFANLVRYLNYEVPFVQIMRISLFYLPKSFSYALPIALLFAAAYTLGDLYARNELTSIFSSGIPFWRFCMSLVLIGLMSSVFSFFFDDMVVIPTLKIKNELSRRFLHQQQRTENNSDIVIKARNGQIIYSVDFYDTTAQVLNGVSIVEQDPRGEFISLIRSPSASWTGEYWELKNPVIYQWENGLLRIRPLPETTSYREQPDTFRRNAVNVDELHARDAGLHVKDLKAAGLPFIEALANYHHRFSFATVSFIVMILSISMGGRFRKNILLMSLLASLSVAVVFYVMEMISMMMARLGYIPPLVGAWFPVFTFIAIGALLLRGART
ncbi:membrane protein [Spirochaetia bacterium]|nr:membrane protein [Spirochaetia bacterium]